MGISSLVDGVHDTPVNVGGDAIELDSELLADDTRTAVGSNKVLAAELLRLTGPDVRKGDCDRVLEAVIILDVEFLHASQAFDDLPVPEEITEIDLLNDRLGRDVQTTVARVGLVRVPENEVASVLPDGGTFNEGTILSDLKGETPLRNSLEVPRLSTISTTGDEWTLRLV